MYRSVLLSSEKTACWGLLLRLPVPLLLSSRVIACQREGKLAEQSDQLGRLRLCRRSLLRSVTVTRGGDGGWWASSGRLSPFS